MLHLSETDISAVLSEAAKTIGGDPEPDPYTREFSLIGSHGQRTSTCLTVTTYVQNGEINISIQNGGPFNLGRIQMPVSHFPGNAESFLRGITMADPNAPSPPSRVYSTGAISRCLSARDGG